MTTMTGEEFKAARIKLGLSVQQLADILGKDTSTVSRWEAPPSASTKTTIDPTAIRVLEWMLDGFRPPQWPTHLRGQRRGPRPASQKQE